MMTVDKIKRLSFTTILILLFFHQGVGQKMAFDNNTKLELKILDKEATLKASDEWLFLNISITNKADSAFILYDFKRINPGAPPIKDYMQPNWVASHTIVVLKKSEWLNILDTDPADPGCFPNGLYNSLQADSTSFIKPSVKKAEDFMFEQRLIIKKGETWTGKLRVPTNKPWLRQQKFYDEIFEVKASGVSELFLIYSCGVNINNVIEESKMKEDEKANDAVLFQGYARSNTIKLKIEKSTEPKIKKPTNPE